MAILCNNHHINTVNSLLCSNCHLNDKKTPLMLEKCEDLHKSRWKNVIEKMQKRYCYIGNTFYR